MADVEVETLKRKSTGAEVTEVDAGVKDVTSPKKAKLAEDNGKVVESTNGKVVESTNGIILDSEAKKEEEAHDETNHKDDKEQNNDLCAKVDKAQNNDLCAKVDKTDDEKPQPKEINHKKSTDDEPVAAKTNESEAPTI